MFRSFEYFRPGADRTATTVSYRGMSMLFWGIGVALVIALIGAAVGVYSVFSSLWLLPVGIVVTVLALAGVVWLVLRTYRHYVRRLTARDDARRGMAGTLDMISHRHIRKVNSGLRTSVYEAQDHARAIAGSRAAREGLLGEVDLDADMYQICRLAVEIDGLERGDLRISTVLAPGVAGSPLADRREKFTRRTAAMRRAAEAVEQLDAVLVVDTPAARRGRGELGQGSQSAAESVLARVQAYREPAE
ncbi:hypothetical protein [Williamsia sp. CHRR-6]|uniref:hypothetical protein n=1 Tax=Williamsia sp. CHRR-6 TaxID=2835871 RepID=UPI001BDAD7EC|nr:hypothetical protein [Williamsia sp. CHRR-6]MBT0566455.1 hypothetical protein [Williamsia sp. CHRR-6]